MLQTLRRTYLDIFRQHPVLARLAAVGACIGVVYALIHGYALPLYLHDNLGASAVVIGWVSSTFLAAEMLTKFPLGRLSDRIGRRPLITAGPAVSCLTAFAIPLIPPARWALLFPLRAVDGVGLAAVWPAAFALVTERIPAASRAAAMAALNSVYVIGLTAGPALGGLLMLAIADPWLRDRSPFYLASGAFLLAALLARFGLPAPPGRVTVAARPRPGPPFFDAAAAAGVSASHPRPAAALMALVLVITALQLLALTILQPFLPLYGVQVMGLSKAQVPLLFVIPAIIVMVLGLPLGHLSDRWGKERSVKTAMVIAAGAMAALPLFSALGAVLAVVTVLIIAYLLGTPAWLALVADLSPRHAYGGTLGAVATAQGVGAAVGPIIGGHLWVLNYRYSFWASAALLFVCAVLVIAFLPRAPVRRDEAADAQP